MNIENKTYSQERALYNISKSVLNNITFSGEEDGESPLKECSKLSLSNSKCDLRYACWHNTDLSVINTVFSDKCRAPFWYCKNVQVKDSQIIGVKSFRECKNILILDSVINSPEFAWRCKNIDFTNVKLEGEYAFFETKDAYLENITFKGKYSFQYTKNIKIINSTLETKDAFWHAKDVVVINSTIKGEYIGWYSKNVTLVNCKIESHQPFCYSKNLRIINCEFINSDLAFEYSNVHAKIKGNIDSIKNPKSGVIIADSIGKIIKDDDKYKGHAKIKIVKK